MAVVNTIDDVLEHPQNSSEITGARVMEVITQIAIAAGDDNGSSYFVCELPDSAILESVTLECAAITAGTDYDLGIFLCDGTVVDVDVLANGLDMSDTTGLPVGPYGDAIRQAMTALAGTDAGKYLYELAGHVNKALPGSGETNRKGKYRLGLTANTVGSAAATIVARVRYLMSV